MNRVTHQQEVSQSGRGKVLFEASLHYPAILAEARMKRVRLQGKQPADGLWRDDSKSSGTGMTLQKMWPQPCMRLAFRPFLDASDFCHLEGVSKFWRENTL